MKFNLIKKEGKARRGKEVSNNNTSASGQMIYEKIVKIQKADLPVSPIQDALPSSPRTFWQKCFQILRKLPSNTGIFVGATTKHSISLFLQNICRLDKYLEIRN